MLWRLATGLGVAYSMAKAGPLQGGYFQPGSIFSRRPTGAAANGLMMVRGCECEIDQRIVEANTAAWA
jgi:CRISPR/Cas system CSM-associated protein Csm4 (group 5 of RAMP superfamily)